MKAKLYTILSMVCMLLLPTGCSDKMDTFVPEYGPEDTDSLIINLNLTVPHSSIGTRSANDLLDLGNEAENFIDIEDYQICIFDKDGKYIGKDLLSDIECTENSVSGGMASYTLKAKLTLTNNEDKDRLSKFQLMVLTNWKSFERSNAQPGFNYPSFDSYTLTGEAPTNIFKNGDDFNFTLNSGGNVTSWVPSMPMPSGEDKGKAIPMFGITNELNLNDVIAMAKYGDAPVCTVPLLRSLAKIEIVNNTQSTQSEDKITIESCRLTAYNSQGRFIPYVYVDNEDPKNSVNAGWSDLDTQISTASLPATYDNGQLDKENLTFVPLDGGKTFVAYLSEIDLNLIANDTKPRMELKIAAHGETLDPSYYIDLGEYNGEFSGNYYPALLRNHKYVFNINKVEVGVKGELNFVIETPWQQSWNDSGEEEWDFENVEVEFANSFQWIGDVNYEEEPGNELIPQRTFVITQDEPVVGTFKLSKPVKGTWTLALYADDVTLNNHFRIDVLSNGVWVDGADAITGDVGEEITFRIIPTATNNDSNHYTARVVMTCMTFDGQIKEVNLTGATELPTVGNNGYYYVKQYYSGFGDNGEDPYEENNLNQ